jgi:hypothetical protein
VPLASVPLAVMDMAGRQARSASGVSCRQVAAGAAAFNDRFLLRPAGADVGGSSIAVRGRERASSVVSREIRCSVDVVLMRARSRDVSATRDFQLEPLPSVWAAPGRALARVAGPEAWDRDEDRVGPPGT